IIVFLPLLYLQGLARAFFGEQAFAVATALLASLVLSLTLTPVLSGRQAAAGRQRSPGLPACRRLLAAALARPALALAAFAVIALASLLAPAALPRHLL